MDTSRLPTSIARALNRWSLDTTSDTVKSHLSATCAMSCGPQTEKQRSYMSVDWFMRTCAPLWYDISGYPSLATDIRNLPYICSPTSLINTHEFYKKSFSQTRAYWLQLKPDLIPLAANFDSITANDVINASADEARKQALEGGWIAMREIAMATLNITIPWDCTRGALVNAMRAPVWRIGLTAALSAPDKTGAARAAIVSWLAPLVTASRASAFQLLKDMST